MFKEILGKLFQQNDLTIDEMKAAMELILNGECTGAQIGSFLTALRLKGESVNEIAGAVEILRSKFTKVPVSSQPLVDTCGTGGDKSGSFNISTAAAIVTAGAGVAVAKHGNRAMSSSCGSANVLQELGLNLELTADKVGESVDKFGLGFLFAMNLHSAMKHVGPARQEIGQRTIFNILGPMINPAGAKRQLFGVFDRNMTEKLAGVLQKTGSEHVLVVAGSDGLDEISLTGATHVSELKNGEIDTFTISPEDFGLSKCNSEDLLGGDVSTNAQIIKDILGGAAGPKRDITVLNAGAAIYISGKAESIPQGINLAQESIDSGKAAEVLKNFTEFSQTS